LLRNTQYALHAPEVECIGKGKASKPYEFGVKVSVAITHKQGLMVGARSFSGNPYDGHTLAEQLEQVTILTQDTGKKPKEVTVDLGFRGVDADNPGVQIIHRGKFKSLTEQQRRWLKRRQAVEPAIGHLKHDNAMDRCWLKGHTGDALHAVLCASGYNIRWLLRAVLRLGLKGLFARLFALLAALASALATAPAGVDPVPWTHHSLCSRSRKCPKYDRRTRRNSVSRWSSSFESAVHQRSSRVSLVSPPNPSPTGSGRPPSTTASLCPARKA
jgi:IS5 family transposase